MKIYQCTKCGRTHKIDDQILKDDIYADVWCSHCKEIVHHLECGEDILEYYENYDVTIDERFYRYKQSKEY